MTAPDPGLTDLIAAEIAKHQLDFGAMWHDDIRACTCGERVEEGYHSPHVAGRVALVVEQHTNGRIAELEATVARVEKLAHDMRGWCSPHGISVTYSDRIRADLEGEQQ